MFCRSRTGQTVTPKMGSATGWKRHPNISEKPNNKNKINLITFNMSIGGCTHYYYRYYNNNDYYYYCYYRCRYCCCCYSKTKVGKNNERNNDPRVQTTRCLSPKAHNDHSAMYTRVQWHFRRLKRFYFIFYYLAHTTTRYEWTATHTHRTRFLFASRIQIKIMSARSAVRRVFCGRVMGNTYLEKKFRYRTKGEGRVVIAMMK